VGTLDPIRRCTPRLQRSPRSSGHLGDRDSTLPMRSRATSTWAIKKSRRSSARGPAFPPSSPSPPSCSPYRPEAATSCDRPLRGHWPRY
jgi:hypothetical protein